MQSIQSSHTLRVIQCYIKVAVNWTKMARNVGPSPAQTERLVGLLETRSDLATGHARTANARTRMQNGWSEIARVLNSDGSGCVKDWKQWAKYWKDKKAAVKRKANSAEAARQRTGGGVDVEVVELSEVERRILTIAGGLSFATGDRHLAINPFPEQENTVPPPAGPESNSSVCENILLQGMPGPSRDSTMMVEEERSVQWDETAAAVVGEGSVQEMPESSPAATPGDEVAGVHISIQDEDETVSPSEVNRDHERSERESPPTPTVRPRGGGAARRRILVATPSQRRRPYLPPSSSQRPSGGSPQRRSPRGVSAARRRLLRRSPPSQRRSEMASLTERFIAIEERRVDAELAIARSQEMFAQGHRMMTEALDRFMNDTIPNVVQRVIEALRES